MYIVQGLDYLMIVIVDFGMGNLGSIQNMLARMNFNAEITSDPRRIKLAEKLILPGVGAFDKAMNNLQDMELLPVLHELVINNKIPLLGICLGMQLLSERSEEGNLKGLGWIAAETVRFKFSQEQELRIPHMGWNTLNICKDTCLFTEMDEEPRFYFVHSYHLKCKSRDTIVAETHYGYDFTSVVHRNNIYGVQFHPEKSHKFGMRLLKNYVELC
jgi:glutamine amidotransferase